MFCSVRLRPLNWVVWTVGMTMHEASQYLILYSSKALWPESTSQKRSSPAETITTNIYVNRLATRLKVCWWGMWGALGGGGSIHGVSFRCLYVSQGLGAAGTSVSLRTGPRFVCCLVSALVPAVR
jgi:hypothetical protein